MAEWDNPYRRWSDLMDRSAVGETLSADELAFCDRFTAAHPACQRELELLEELSQLDVAPNADSRAIVDGALARLAAESARFERDEISLLKPGLRVPRVAWLSGAAAAAAVGLALWFMPHKPAPNAGVQQQPMQRIELVYAAGDVRVDGKPANNAATLLAQGSVIEIGSGSACVAMDPGIDVCGGEHTRLRLARTHSQWRMLELQAGKVAVQLVPQPEGWRFSIVSDGVWSTAVGTAFTVERNAEQGVRTTVLNGKVRVGRDGGNEQIVAAHQRSQLHQGVASLSAISRNEESPEWAMLRPATLWSDPVSARLELRGLPAGVAIVLDGQPIGVAPLSTLVPSGAHSLQVRGLGDAGEHRVMATREFVSEVGQLTVLTFSAQQLAQADAPEALPEATDLVPIEVVSRAARPAKLVAVKLVEAKPTAAEFDALAPAPAPHGGASEMLAEAHKLMRAGRFDLAAARYQALRQSYPESAEARTVLVSLAELQVDRLASPRQALQNLDRYLDAGDGTLVEEARRVRIRALHALGDEREAAAIEEFLRAHPKSFQAPTLRRRLAEMSAQP